MRECNFAFAFRRGSASFALLRAPSRAPVRGTIDGETIDMGVRLDRGAKNLRLADLARRRGGDDFELLSVRLPLPLLRRVDALVERIGGGKAEVVIALLNEGLDRYRHGRPARTR
jgi:hypothetical protein